MEKNKAMPTLEEFQTWCMMEVMIWEERMKELDRDSQMYSDAKLVLMGMSYTMASIKIFKQERERRC